MATWSKETILSFINLYKSKECLWKVKSKDYNNRFLREVAYGDLITFCQQFNRGANKDFVTKKINNLRTAFRKEQKKQAGLKLAGDGVDDIYEPKLWYFQELMFLADQETPKLGRIKLPCDESLHSNHSTSPPESEVCALCLFVIIFLNHCHEYHRAGGE